MSSGIFKGDRVFKYRGALYTHEATAKGLRTKDINFIKKYGRSDGYTDVPDIKAGTIVWDEED